MVPVFAVVSLFSYPDGSLNVMFDIANVLVQGALRCCFRSLEDLHGCTHGRLSVPSPYVSCLLRRDSSCVVEAGYG